MAVKLLVLLAGPAAAGLGLLIGHLWLRRERRPTRVSKEPPRSASGEIGRGSGLEEEIQVDR